MPIPKKSLITKLHKLIALSVLLLWVQISFAQETKKVLDLSVYDSWEKIDNQAITDKGNYISYEVNPQEGDGKLYFFETQTSEAQTFNRGQKAKFSPNSDFAIFKIVPFADSVRQAKLDKKKKDEMPKDSMGIFIFSNKKLITKAGLKSFKLPEEKSSWLAYMVEPEADDSTSNEKKKSKDKDFPETATLVIFNPISQTEHQFDSIAEYDISRDGQTVNFIKFRNDSLRESSVFVFDTKKEELTEIFKKTGIAKKITAANYAKHTAFIFTEDTVKNKCYALYLSDGTDYAKRMADTTSTELEVDFAPSVNSGLRFSRNDEKLYFGIAPKPEPEAKDTLLDSEKVNVDIWHWQDEKLQPEQLAEKKEELNRTYKTVLFIKNNKIIQLEDEQLQHVSEILKGNGNRGIATDSKPYRKSWSWEIPGKRDIYIVDFETGKRKKILSGLKLSPDLSPEGKYSVYYNFKDSLWYAYDNEADINRAITKEAETDFFDESHDYPSPPYPHGIAGWTKDDAYVLIYDRYDIWKIDPKGKEKPVNLTNEFGRKNKVRLRFLQLDREADFIDSKSNLFLYAFDEESKKSGYFSSSAKKAETPEPLIFENMRFSYRPIKAKGADYLLWTKQDIEEYPNLWLSNTKLDNPRKITTVNKQKQAQYNWASVEEVKWINTDGEERSGLLYKPENFDPTKKYPMMVYFYRKHSENLYRHYAPSPSRSIINPVFYASRGYLVFMPDITFKTGYPGESSYNHVISGTLAMINKGFVDKNNIGLQGQSWGGYQIAYIVTKTDLFKCASPGAPVSNMTSAYGGIRWTSGMSRMFQYEQTQSRIGGTLWEKPLHYIENSPVFYVPKINTPLLIRHDDADGAVPWYQGIELFVAMRRLNKPAWLINYNDAPHNLTEKRANQKDWSKRMLQFFDHYLKDDPAPEWLKSGIPAVEKGETMGFETD
jgi:dipeptidyl aminopeptidase/acylaminoacyl peptidase